MKFLIFFYTFGFLQLQLVSGLICPEEEVLYPCTCDKGSIVCAGADITQESISETFKQIRLYNGLDQSEQLTMTSLQIANTTLNHVDLTPFMNLSVTNFRIRNNTELVSLSGPTPIEFYQGLINVEFQLGLQMNALTDEGLGEILKYFSSSLNIIYLYENQLKGSSENFEFFPGLSSFSELQQISFYSNQIEVLGGGQFKKNTQLGSLFLSDNPNLRIEKDAFIFEQSISNGIMLIELNGCDLNDSSINNHESGLVAISQQRQLHLFLQDNSFEFLSTENFEEILRSPKLRRLFVGGNPLVCDERMKWLHDEKDLFQNKVSSAFCINDPGFDVFTTSLIQ